MGEESPSRRYVAGVIALYWFIGIPVYISIAYIQRKMYKVSGHQWPPLFRTWAQCIVTCVICWVCGMLGQSMRGGQSGTGREKPESERPVGAKPSLSSFLAPKARYNRDAAIKVLPLSFIFVVGRIVSLELIPKYVDFYFYDIIRPLTIVFIAVFSVVILGSFVSCRTIGSLVVVITGFIFGFDGKVQLLSIPNVLCGLIQSAVRSLSIIYIKKALPHVMNDVWRLSFTNSANAFFLFIPAVLYFEGGALWEHSHALFTAPFVMGLVITGMLGFIASIVSLMQIRTTSPLTHIISETARAGVLNAFAFCVWGGATPIAWAGAFLVLFGSTLYADAKITQVQKGPAELEDGNPLLPE